MILWKLVTSLKLHHVYSGLNKCSGFVKGMMTPAVLGMPPEHTNGVWYQSRESSVRYSRHRLRVTTCPYCCYLFRQFYDKMILLCSRRNKDVLAVIGLLPFRSKVTVSRFFRVAALQFSIIIFVIPITQGKSMIRLGLQYDCM